MLELPILRRSSRSFGGGKQDRAGKRLDRHHFLPEIASEHEHCAVAHTPASSDGGGADGSGIASARPRKARQDMRAAQRKQGPVERLPAVAAHFIGARP